MHKATEGEDLERNAGVHVLYIVFESRSTSSSSQSLLAFQYPRSAGLLLCLQRQPVESDTDDAKRNVHRCQSAQNKHEQQRKLATDFERTNDGGTANARDTPLRVHHSRNVRGVVGLLASIDPARIGARIHFPACLIVSMAGTFGLFIFGNQF